MPIFSIINVAGDVFFGGDTLDSLSFRNGSAAGTIYIRFKPQSNALVSSTSYEWSLGPGASVGVTRVNDGTGIIGPWAAISSAAGGVTLEILPIYRGGRKGN